MIKISIITVTYNAEKALQATIDSVCQQTYPNIEYIVVDGNSKDRTVDIIKENANAITKWVSEPDKGLYDAMNKGLALATGDYVWFLNAGDLIKTNTTTEEIVASSDKPADIYYGETSIIDSSGKHLGMRRLKAPKKLTWKSFRMGMLVCHQSILVKREFTVPYDLQYKISADIDWVIKALKKAAHIQNTNMVISIFENNGVSSNNFLKSNSERFRIMLKHYGCFQAIFFNIIMIFRLIYTYLKLGRM